jgi:hypothetical protein
VTQSELDAQLQAARDRVRQSEAAVAQPAAAAGADSWWSVTQAMTISSVVLVFGVFVLLLATYLIRIGKNSEPVLRIFGTILIIVISVFLVVAGYTSNQIAPVMGLLGTIAGYLLGKDAGARSEKEPGRDPTK